jgi:two-component system NarL family sensor kinase
MYGEHDKVIGTVGIARDITLRKIFEGELRDFPARLLAVQEAERLRVSRELHDGVNQLLASVQMRIRHLHHTLSDKPAGREILGRCQELLSEALEENRRIAHDLRPSELDQLGLVDACRNLCKELGLRGKLKVRCHLARLEQRLAPKIELHLFRIVQEAFNNVEKHAKAKHVSLTLGVRGDYVVLKIRDDGRGFDPISAQSPRPGARGIGLSNILERAGSLNGHCEIESAPKGGTTITVRVPRA